MIGNTLIISAIINVLFTAVFTMQLAIENWAEGDQLDDD